MISPLLLIMLHLKEMHLFPNFHPSHVFKISIFRSLRFNILMLVLIADIWCFMVSWYIWSCSWLALENVQYWVANRDFRYHLAVYFNWQFQSLSGPFHKKSIFTRELDMWSRNIQVHCLEPASTCVLLKQEKKWSLLSPFHLLMLWLIYPNNHNLKEKEFIWSTILGYSRSL